MVQWVISVNLQPEENRADHYLDEVQRKPGQLEIASQTIKKFNQALVYAQNGSDDLAVAAAEAGGGGTAQLCEGPPAFGRALYAA